MWLAESLHITCPLPSLPSVHSEADVEVLGGLASLETLRLRRQEFEAADAHPAEALAALRAALPHCQIDA